MAMASLARDSGVNDPVASPMTFYSRMDFWIVAAIVLISPRALDAFVAALRDQNRNITWC